MNANFTVVVGRVANTPHFTPNSMPPESKRNNARLYFRLAVNRDRRAGDNKTHEPDYINVTVWGKSAEAGSKNISQGKELLIVGQIRTASKKLENGQWENHWSVSANYVSYGADSKKQRIGQEIGRDLSPADRVKALESALVDARKAAEEEARRPAQLTPEQLQQAAAAGNLGAIQQQLATLSALLAQATQAKAAAPAEQPQAQPPAAAPAPADIPF